MLCVTALLSISCAGAGAALGTIAFQAGKKFLLSTSEKNFDEEYHSSFSKMLDLLVAKEPLAATPNAFAKSDVDIALTTASAGDTTTPVEETVADAVDKTPPASTNEIDIPAAAPPSFTARNPINLSLNVVREVVLDARPIPVPVEDGDTLRDGFGREGDGDNIKIQFEVDQTCYVYAVWIDATAWATPLFPASAGGSFENPVQPGRLYSIPKGNDWWYLDDRRGVENLYFVASHTPLQELGNTLAAFVGRERVFQGAEVALVDQPTEITRGLGGVRPGRATLVQASDGNSHEVVPTSFLSDLGSRDLVVTRWFRHE